MNYLNFFSYGDLAASLPATVVFFGGGRRVRRLIEEALAQASGETSFLQLADEGEKAVFLSDGTEIPRLSMAEVRRLAGEVLIILSSEEGLLQRVMGLGEAALPDRFSYTIAIREFFSACACGRGEEVPPPVMSGHAIPKILHCFWAGAAEKPPLYAACMETWKAVMPGWTIMEWGPDVWDISAFPFAESAAEQGAWAFVSDVARLDVVNRFGGIYLDLDVEAVRPLDDVLQGGAFFAYDAEVNIDLGSGFGAEIGHPLLAVLLSAYDGKTFTNFSDFNQPAFLRQVFLDAGFAMAGDYEVVGDTVIYPRNRFTPYDSIAHIAYADSSGTYSRHLFHSGWLQGERMSRRDSRYDWYDSVVSAIGREAFRTASLAAIRRRRLLNP